VVVHNGGQKTGRQTHQRHQTLTVMLVDSSTTSSSQSTSRLRHPGGVSRSAAPALIDVPLLVEDESRDVSPPQLLIGSHVMVQVNTAVRLGPDVLSAVDLDTQPDRLQFYVTRTPQHGRLHKQQPTLNRRGLSVLCTSCSPITRCYTTCEMKKHRQKAVSTRHVIS